MFHPHVLPPTNHLLIITGLLFFRGDRILLTTRQQIIKCSGFARRAKGHAVSDQESITVAPIHWCIKGSYHDGSQNCFTAFMWITSPDTEVNQIIESLAIQLV